MKTNYDGVDFSVMNVQNLMPAKQVKALTFRQQKSTLKEDPTTVNDNRKLLEMAFQYWSALQDFRDRRKKNRLYYRGDQWHELIEDPDTGESITEENYIKNQGKIPFKQNMIRQVIKNVLGQYRMNPMKSMVVARAFGKGTESDMLTNALRSVLDINKVTELDVRNFEEYLVSGAIIGKVRYKYWKERNTEDVWIENTSPARTFYNSGLADIRMTDLNTIGELIDDDLDNIIGAFAASEADAEKIRQWYTHSAEQVPTVMGNTLSTEHLDAVDFYMTYDTTKYRVIEIWYIKSEWRTYVHDTLDGTYNIVPFSIDKIAQANAQRIAYAATQGIPTEQVPLMEATRKYEQFWCFKYLTPWGQTLAEGETPYGHDSHPYCMALYPLLDGEVWGFVEDILDQQRYINRLISLQDFIMGASAKGVLLVPEEAISDDFPMEDIAEEWTKFNGIIKIKTKQGVQIPQQITSRANLPGLWEMISMQMKLIQDIAGVHEALQGQAPKAGTPSSLYAQQAQYSLTNLKEYLEFFAFFKEQRDLKALKVLRQYYNDKRYFASSGVSADAEKMVYDPEKVRNLEIELKVAPSMDTPVYRQIIDDMLFQLLQAQMIDISMFLENSSLPFADRLLEQIKQKQQEMMQQGAIPQGGVIDPALAQQVQQQASKNGNPQAMQMVQQLMAQPN
jgi:hypothetical protein